MYLRPGINPSHMVIQFRTATNELPLVFRTSAYFVVPDITVLVTQKVIPPPPDLVMQ
jgi:hypothetical protein